MNGWMVPVGDTQLSASYQPQRWYVAALAISSFGVAMSVSMAWPRPRRPRPSRRIERPFLTMDPAVSELQSEREGRR